MGRRAWFKRAGIPSFTGGIIKIVINWFLVARRDINIYGAPVGTLCSYCAMAAMVYVFMCRTLDHRPRLLRVFSGPMAASVLMGLTAWGVYGLCQRALMGSRRIGTLVAMCAAIGAAVIVYLITAIVFKAVTKEDMKLIPGGAKIARILHMR